MHNIGVTNNKGFTPNSFSQENKIVIASRLLKKIRLYSKKIYLYMENAKRKMRLFQSKLTFNTFEIDQGLNVVNNKTLDEDLLYTMFAVLTFYLSLLKHPYFDIDANLRMKIFWEGHPTKCKDDTYKHDWL